MMHCTNPVGNSLRQVWKGSVVRHLGYFEDEVAAARAYDRAVLDLRGPTASTNFDPDEYGGGPAAAAPPDDAPAPLPPPQVH